MSNTKHTPLVSVIVPTFNSAATLARCLRSIQHQSYPAIEVIVVDNFSTDSTQEIARRYTKRVYSVGPERSSQRNFGIRVAAGTYILMIDSDMELQRDVVKECVFHMEQEQQSAGMIIPEESVGEGFWARCKQLERQFYVGVPWIEAARFFRAQTLRAVGGYTESLIAGEDWDLSSRIAKHWRIGRINSYIYHHEGRLRLFALLRKKYYYATHLVRYQSRGPQTSVVARYRLFFSRPDHLFREPLVGIGMLFMKTCEFGAGALSRIKTA